MRQEQILSPLRQSIRLFDRNALEFHLQRLLKQANEPICPPRLRARIYLEAVKALRVTNRLADAAFYADLAIANIPADTLEVLSALKRLRALVFLDQDDITSARRLIDETDGMELVLDASRSLISRNNDEVKVETWLVGAEISLASGDVRTAQTEFDLAAGRLSLEGTELRGKRISPLERKQFEQYYHDVGQMLSLYGLTLGLMSGAAGDRHKLEQLYRRIADENAGAAATRKLPNVALLSRLSCLLGKWMPPNECPPGLSLPEAQRWRRFGEGAIALRGDSPAPLVANENFLELTNPPALPVTTPEPNETLMPLAPATGSGMISQSDMAAAVNVMAFERLLGQFESFLPLVKSHLTAEQRSEDFTKKEFGGHLLATDLYNFMQNFATLQFTGYLELKWSRDLYEMVIIKGMLPEIARSGKARMYVAGGVVVDAVFDGQSEEHTLETAQKNFVLLTRMCLSIGVDNTAPNIVGKAFWEAAVEERAPLLSVGVNDLLYLCADIESAIAGVSADEPDQETSSEAEAPLQPAPTVADFSPASAAPDLKISENDDDLFGLSGQIGPANMTPTLSENEKKPAHQEPVNSKTEQLLEII